MEVPPLTVTCCVLQLGGSYVITHLRQGHLAGGPSLCNGRAGDFCNGRAGDGADACRPGDFCNGRPGWPSTVARPILRTSSDTSAERDTTCSHVFTWHEAAPSGDRPLGAASATPHGIRHGAADDDDDDDDDEDAADAGVSEQGCAPHGHGAARHATFRYESLVSQVCTSY